MMLLWLRRKRKSFDAEILPRPLGLIRLPAILIYGFRVGDVYHHRFWGQLARWSAAEKLLPAGNRFVRYGPREPVFTEGQEAELAVQRIIGKEWPERERRDAILAWWKTQGPAFVERRQKEK